MEKNAQYLPKKKTFPSYKQAVFLAYLGKEALYGGAAGGGKTEALLASALLYVHLPTYRAIIFRSSYTDLELPDGLIPRSQEWLGDTDAKWNGSLYRWRFPTGAVLHFGYLSSDKDKYRYQGAAFHYEAFDEVTQFTEAQYRYLTSRNRRASTSNIPLRIRGATNPGGQGHAWVRQRFLIEGPEKKRIFIPSLMHENPGLDVKAYHRTLMELDPVTRAQLLYGDWDVRETGGKFKREWFKIVKDYPRNTPSVRYWDLAATEPKQGRDPDYTAGVLICMDKGQFYIIDVRRTRNTPAQVEALIRQTAAVDEQRQLEYNDIYMEEEPGSSGKNTISHYSRNVLTGYSFRGYAVSGTKELRANPLSAGAEAGNVFLVEGAWLTDFLEEIEQFPKGAHDDQVDAASGAFEILARRARSEIEVSFGKRRI